MQCLPDEVAVYAIVSLCDAVAIAHPHGPATAL